MGILRTIIALSLMLIAVSAAGGEALPYALRNQHPFLHIYGLPAFQTAILEKPGEGALGLSFDMANHAETGENAAESLVLDGESYFVNLTWRRGVRNWLELGIDVPLVAHSDGVFDSAIRNWHSIWGMSNSKRNGSDGELRLFYELDQVSRYDILDPVSGIGDIQLSAAIPLGGGNETRSRRSALRFGVKLPTGDSNDLLGSGALDASLALYVDDSISFLGRPTGISGFAGVIALGNGDVLPEKQEDFVPFGGAALTWHASDRFGITAQMQAQGAYIDSDLDELGGSSIQLAVGGVFRPGASGWTLSFALVEDLVSDATPDFGLHFGLTKLGGR